MPTWLTSKSAAAPERLYEPPGLVLPQLSVFVRAKESDTMVDAARSGDDTANNKTSILTRWSGANVNCRTRDRFIVTPWCPPGNAKESEMPVGTYLMGRNRTGIENPAGACVRQ